ncbi:hypothetical protein [Amycolatopsis taiwanensis]|uniref:PPE family domain-containing protein n=1 Tax=Amycolatopsis taiwanensis TaxID=342230 RepID=A0A9W6R3D5_9PSEU|nr:hypothetical protein [Amycolatopsis taiwanensis]GLY68771.1 hypothetical protein Atai01_53900 [Amycolatopsis taiwanensis]
MTQPDGGSAGYTPRAYESEVYAKVAEANANKIVWDPSYRDPAKIAGKYSNKSAEFYERKLVAESGSYRAGLDASDILYQSMPHDQMVAMVRDGVSAQDVDEKGVIINKLGNAFKKMSTTLQQAVTKEQAGWQGVGADAAFHYLSGLSKWSDTAGDAAFLTANRYSRTSAAIANAQNSMPEPTGRTVTQSMDLARQQFQSGNFMDGIATLKDTQNQATIHFQAQQQAAAVLTARDQTLYNTGSKQPVYTAPPQPATPTPAAAGTIAGTTGASGVGSIANPHVELGRTSAASAGLSSPPTAGPSGASNVTGFSGVAPSIPVQGGATTDSGPSWGSNPGPVPGPGGGWLRTPSPTFGPGLEVGLVSPVTGTGSGGGDIERGGPGGGGSGSGNSSGRAGGRASGGGATEASPGAGKRSGVAEPGAKAAAEAARTGATGKAGKSGASGMPGAAVGGKKSEDDKEHKRPGYVVDGDPRETFGLNIETDDNGNKIAPPVLGT